MTILLHNTMNIPEFKSQEHQEEYELLFTEKAVEYVKLMDVVKELMYGKGTGNYANLPGTCLEVVRDITQSLLYDTEYTFKAKYSEYKTDDDELFIPRRSFKEDVSAALNEVLDDRDKKPWAHPDSNLNL